MADMSTSSSTQPSDTLLVMSVRLLVQNAALIVRITTAAAVMSLALALAYFAWGQPVRSVTTLGLEFLFDEANRGVYPNGLRFAASDIIAPSILERIYKDNGIGDFCPRESFDSGWFVEESSPELRFLEMEYEARLADQRLPIPERERQLQEFRSRRAALSREYRLHYVRPDACSRLPQVVVLKALSEAPLRWAEESDQRRGVMRQRIPMVSPALFESDVAGAGTLPAIRADILRVNIERVKNSISILLNHPGADVVRTTGPAGSPEAASAQGLTLIDVNSQLKDLVDRHLQPGSLLLAAGSGPEAMPDLEERLRSAVEDERAARQRVQAHQSALAEYAGPALTVQRPDSRGTPNPSDVQGMAPQLDGTFIDRLLAMSGANTAFRQELTRGLLQAELSVVGHVRRVSDAERTLAVARRAKGQDAQKAQALLNDVAKQASALTARVNEIYELYSKVTLRPAAELYRTTTPPFAYTSRSFGIRHVTVVTVVGTLSGFLLALVIVLGRRIRQVRAL